MADFYLDISAIGNEYQAYTDTPTTWAVPQDGNGKDGPGHSAAVAIATIDVAGCTASGAGTIGVLGVTVSSTLNASGSALATAIAAAVNAATTAVSATYSALLLPLNRLVYARVNPGLNTQVQIMLRIAGADWVGFSPTQSGISPAATISNFAGGADGPFAYMVNNTAVFGKAQGAYGIWFAASAGVTEPAIATDVIIKRSRRSGVDLSHTITHTAAASLTWKQRNYLIDDGTSWTGDSGTLTVNIQNTSGSSAAVSYGLGTSALLLFASRSKYNFEVTATCAAAGSAITFCAANNAGSKFVFSKCQFIEMYGNASNNLFIFSDSAASSTGYVADIGDSFIQYQATTKNAVNVTGGSSAAYIGFNGTVVEVVAASGTLGKVINIAGTSFVGKVEWIGGEIRDTNGVYRCSMPINAAASITNVSIIIDGVIGVTDAVVGVTAAAIGNFKLWWNSPEGPTRAFRLETNQFVTDWKGDGTFPHCGAVSPQGDAWSQRVTWSAAPSRQLSVTPLKLSYFYRDTAAIKTIALELYTPDATPFYTDELEARIAYVDSSDVWRVEVVGAARALQLMTGRSEIASSAKAWTANGVAAFSAKKLSLTTAYPIKQNSEVSISLSLCKARTPSVVFYVSPEPTVT